MKKRILSYQSGRARRPNPSPHRISTRPSRRPAPGPSKDHLGAAVVSSWSAMAWAPRRPSACLHRTPGSVCPYKATRPSFRACPRRRSPPLLAPPRQHHRSRTGHRPVRHRSRKASQSVVCSAASAGPRWKPSPPPALP
jgi:hypothetical protein